MSVEAAAQRPPAAAPCRDERRAGAQAPARRRTVDEPDRDRERYRKRRQDAEGRHRERTGGAGRKTDQRALPSRSQNDARGESLHAWRALASVRAAGASVVVTRGGTS